MSLKLAIVCALGGILLAALGWLLPAHLRAVDARILRAASAGGRTVDEKALELARLNHFGAADLLRQASRHEGSAAANDLDRLLSANPPGPSMTDEFIRTRPRQDELARLERSAIPAVHALLQTRAVATTKLFAPSASAAGQAFDTAVAIAGFLIDRGNVTGPLRDAIENAASSANRGGDPEPVERILLDFLSLGQRLNQDQAGVLVNNIQDQETFTILAEETRNAGPQLPALFAAVVLSGQPRAVASYLRDFNQTGLRDLVSTLPYGSGGVTELLRRQERIYGSVPATGNQFTRGLDNFSLRQPEFALTLKCLCYLLAGFLLAEAANYARPAPSARERPLEVRGAHYARGSLFAMGFLLVALLLSEPFLAQESQKLEIRVRLPMMGGPAVPGATHAKPVMLMNRSTLMTLLLFFVLQALLYIACLVKLAEIKRQNTVARVKLKLLENEDHLFDAGLYLGFCGTIVSLILVSVGVIEQSLMAAYSSTSFGIIFVSIFKIFQLRPARRDLLLQAEEDHASGEGDVARTSLATLP